MLLQLSIINLPYDSTLFTHTTFGGKILLLLYVNDMIIIKDDSYGAFLKNHLSKPFEMKNIRPLDYFHGNASTHGYVLPQIKYLY